MAKVVALDKLYKISTSFASPKYKMNQKLRPTLQPVNEDAASFRYRKKAKVENNLKWFEGNLKMPAIPLNAAAADWPADLAKHMRSLFFLHVAW